MTVKPFILGRFSLLKGNYAGVSQGGSPRPSARSARPLRLAGNVRGLPQVVFKVAKNGGCHGPSGLASQLDYVLGKADHIIDPTKRCDRLDHLPKELSKAIAAEWSDGWHRKIASGHSMHMIASFPRGTDTEKVAEIMRLTCHDLLDQGRGRFNYVAAVHTDRDHPHAHIVVDRRNVDGEFFYLAQNHEFSYDRFKDAIVDHAAELGISLVNSSRLSRGLTTDPEPYQRQQSRGLEGELIAVGTAPYKNKPNARDSYFATVKTDNGEKTLWGKELRRAIEESKAEVGRQVRIIHAGKEAVSIKTPDGQTIEVHRNSWTVETPGRERHTSHPVADEANVASALWRREQVLQHAASYRTMAEFTAAATPALSHAFNVAAETLERGGDLSLNTNMMEDKAMADALEKDDEKLTQMINNAYQDLLVVREKIPELRPADRPAIEAQYFNAVRDMQEVTNGIADKALTDAPHGTIYDPVGNEGLRSLSADTLAARFEGTGIDPEEVAARLQVSTGNAALEAHWAETDATAIAEVRGYDMTTEAGRGMAFADLQATYSNVLSPELEGELRGEAIEQLKELDQRAQDEWGEDTELDASTDAMEQRAAEEEISIPVMTGSGQQLSLSPSQIREMAATDPSLRLVEPVENELLEPTDANIAALRDYHADQQGRDAIDYDAASDPDSIGRKAEERYHSNDMRELVDVVEQKQDSLTTIRDLSDKLTMTEADQRLLVEAVETVLSAEQLRELRSGHSSALSAITSNPEERFALAEKYLSAESAQGANRTDALAAIQGERTVHELDAKTDHEKTLAERERAFRERQQENGLER